MLDSTIPIEAFADRVRSAFVSFSTKLIWAQLSTVAPWLNVPFVSHIIKWLIGKGVDVIATQGGLVAFMINTKIFTLDQAKDYRHALEELYKLPPNVSDELWKEKENAANLAFERFIRFSS